MQMMILAVFAAAIGRVASNLMPCLRRNVMCLLSAVTMLPETKRHLSGQLVGQDDGSQTTHSLSGAQDPHNFCQ